MLDIVYNGVSGEFISRICILVTSFFVFLIGVMILRGGCLFEFFFLSLILLMNRVSSGTKNFLLACKTNQINEQS